MRLSIYSEREGEHLSEGLLLGLVTLMIRLSSDVWLSEFILLKNTEYKLHSCVTNDNFLNETFLHIKAVKKNFHFLWLKTKT